MTDGPRVSPLGDHAQENMTRETSQAMQIWPGQDIAEDSARQANLEAVSLSCAVLRPTTGHYGSPMMMMVMIIVLNISSASIEDKHVKCK